MDGSRIRKEKVADSKIFGYVWTGPKTEPCGTPKVISFLADVYESI